MPTSCPSCGKEQILHRVNGTNKLRCDRCGRAFRRRSSSRLSKSCLDRGSTRSDQMHANVRGAAFDARAADQEEGRHAQPEGGHAKFLLFLFLGFGLIVVSLTTFVVITERSRRDQRRAQVTAVTQALEGAAAKAESHVAEYDFDEALAALHPLRDRIDALGEAGLDERLRKEITRVRAARYEFDTKVRRGYVIFEGKLIPRTERARIVAEREKERLRKIEKARRSQEEARKKAEHQKLVRRFRGSLSPGSCSGG